MNDRTKKEQEEQKQQLKQAIANLALQLELQEGRRFNINHGSAEVVKVVKFAVKSEEPDVKRALEKTLEIMTPAQKTYFTKQGISLDGDKVEKPDDPEKAGKKKIIYRGQEKWV